MPLQTNSIVVPNMVIVRQNKSSDRPAIIQPGPDDEPSMPLSSNAVHNSEVGHMDQIADLQSPPHSANEKKEGHNDACFMEAQSKRKRVNTFSAFVQPKAAVVDVFRLQGQKAGPIKACPLHGKPLSAAPTLPTLRNGPNLAPLKIPPACIIPSPLLEGKFQTTQELRNNKRRKVIGIIERSHSEDSVPVKSDVIADAAIALSELHRVPQSTPNTPEVLSPFMNALPPPPFQLGSTHF